MTAIADHPRSLLLARLRDPARWMATVDIVAVLLALTLPWSTSLVGILGVVMVLAMLPVLDAGSLARLLKQPIAAAPVALFLLALAGTLWSDAAWGARLYAVGPTAKLLVLPFLFQHFQRSERGLWVFIAFLASCALMVVMSWIVAFFPGLTLKAKDVASHGIFVKNYIDQSQEFALFAVALAYPVVMLARAGRVALAVVLCALALAFVSNMAFVIVSRTALVTMPIMLGVFGLLHLRWRTTLLILCVAAIAGGIAWMASPQLQGTVHKFKSDYQSYMEEGANTSIGERLEYYKKSLHFFAEAPLKGHGTGSTRALFEQAASGAAAGSAAAEVVGNPHNQTLNVAVQWGVIGVVLLYAMWLSHLMLFRGEGLINWIGLLVVVQNIFTSLFNSHIFDFHEGWMYVMGVGVAGGMVLKAGAAKRTDIVGVS
ncbi:O-antigen ligase family protein [Bradyrhizobium sp. Tv2a-2]|uniref:O-antigen ligase family protein n=1 Tax=Bradyrhizobium sp. Tv2a-2 TaxID=113395 RepID=UPI0004219655|nr:O-antigen ligase family protein [Bradyrhizobium sp. Tv2a-2]